MSKFSVVMPTIWSPKIDNIDILISKINNCEFIHEIIIINNNPNKYNNRYSKFEKVKEFKYDNIYVNPAWNIGVFHSECENICLLSDDINFSVDIFKFIINQFKNENVKIIGSSKLSYTLDKDLEFAIEQISIRNRGWGCLIFVKKSAYIWIPNDLKIHFGDDFLIKQLSGYVWRLNGLKIESIISESINSNSEFNKIIEEDNKNSIKYGLPWSNDY